MRVVVLILSSLMLWFNGVGQTLIDSYSESNNSGEYTMYSGGLIISAQSFTNTTSATLNSCKFYIKKVNSPTGNIYAYIYAHTGTFGTSSTPTGSALATSDAIDVSTLSTSFTLKTFTFSGANKITLTASTYYVVAIGYNGGNASNHLRTAWDDTSPSHGGNASYYMSSWNVHDGHDVCFYVYADDTPAPPPPCAPTNIGNTATGTTEIGNNYLVCNKYVTTNPYTVVQMRTYGTMNGNVKVSIYDHDAGNDLPENRLFTEVASAVTSGVWSTITIPTTYLPAGTYWIMFNMDNWTSPNSAITYSAVTGATMKWLALTYSSSFPATASNTGWAGLSNGAICIYAVSPCPSNVFFWSPF